MDKVTTQQLEACGLSKEQAQRLVTQVNECLSAETDCERWRRLTLAVLNPEHPDALQHYLYHRVYHERDQQQNPGPVWFPDEKAIAKSHIQQALTELSLDNYQALHHWSVTKPDEFWSYVIKTLGIVFQKSPTAVLDLKEGVEQAQWLPDSKLNIVDSCLQAPQNSVAIVYHQDNQIQRMSYGELQSLTNRVANGLCKMGFQTGDAIAINMPMHENAVAIYLGIIKAGCVVVSIADSFAPNEIATRLTIAKTKAIFTQKAIQRNGKTLPLYDKVIEAKAPQAIVLGIKKQEKQLREHDCTWDDFLVTDNHFESQACSPDHAINILFSSGTTAEPKAIPWTHTTAIKTAMDAYYHQDIHEDDVLAWPTNLGWMMGPWLVFAALMNKATMALYDDVPTNRAFGEFVQHGNVTVLGLVPSIVSAWRSSDCMRGLDWSRIKAYSSSGECSNPEDMLFLMGLAGYKPVIEYCGGTEIGGAYISSTVVQDNIPATFSTPTLGLDLVLLDENGIESDSGEVALIPPSMGLSNTLLNKNHHQEYYQDMPHSASGQILRRHGDQFERIANGYYRALGRADDTMNLGGIKISAVEIERVLAECEQVIETAAVACHPKGGGPSQLIIYAQVKTDIDVKTLQKEMQQLLRSQLNPLFKIHEVLVIDRLPRTASNKVMRRLLRDRY